MERRHQVRRATGATGGLPRACADQRRWPPGGVPGLGQEAGTVCDAPEAIMLSSGCCYLLCYMYCFYENIAT